MKFASLGLILMSLLPLSILVRRYSIAFSALWFCLGFFPFLLNAVPFLDIAVISLSDDWIGFAHGVEVSAIDFIVVLCFVSLHRRTFDPRFLIPFVLYLIAISFSLQQAAQPMAAFFGVWQFLRMMCVVVVVACARDEPDVPFLILKGMALGMALQMTVSIWQHAMLGHSQAPGLFVHQNTLGMVAHFVLYPHLALLLASRREQAYVGLTVLACLLVVVLTASRATVGIASLGVAITYVIISMGGLNQRLIGIALAGFLVISSVTPIALGSFSSRFQQAPLSEDSYDERAAFSRAARFIFEDYPAGVGMNHYVSVAKAFGYSERAGVAASEGNRNNIVHNAYWLAAAETGYAGLITFCLMLVFPIFVALRTAVTLPNNPYRALLLGSALAIAMCCLHSFYEWVIFGKEVQYFLSIAMGMIALVAVQSRHGMPRKIPPSTAPRAHVRNSRRLSENSARNGRRPAHCGFWGRSSVMS